MKKRLLLLMTLVLGGVCAFAQTYYYTFDGRYRVNADAQNLITNGDFADGTFTGFTQVDGTEILTDNISCIGGQGPDGKNCITIMTALGKVSNYVTGDDGGWVDAPLQVVTSANFFRSIPVEAGTYIFTYKVKGATDNTRTYIAKGNNQRCPNTQSVYYNETGEPEVITTGSENSPANTVVYGSTEWTQVNYYVNMATAGCVNIMFYNLNQGDSFADFALYPCTAVGDDRDVQDVIDEYTYYLGLPGFSEAREGIEEEMLPMLEALAAATDVPNDMGFTDGDVESTLQEILDAGYDTEFLAANSFDLTPYFNNFTFDNSTSGWTVSGFSRTSDTWKNFTTGHLYTAANSDAANGLGAASASQSVSLPEGDYLYVIQAQAHQHSRDGSGKSNNHQIPDYYTPIKGLYMFINGDTLYLDDVPTYRGKKYFLYAHQPEGVQTIGFYTPGSAGVSGDVGGGRHRFDNIRIYMVGTTEAEVIGSVLDANKATLTSTIANAQAYADSARYMFGKDVLRDSIAAAQSIHDNAPSTFAGIQTVQRQIDYVNAAIRAYETLNLEYTTLGDNIAECNEFYAATADFRNGRDAFLQAIATAQGVYGAATATNRDSLGLVQADSTLTMARVDYETANASFNNPGELYVVNNSFQQRNSNGWVQDGLTGTPAWRFQEYDDFTERYCIHYDRGYTAADEKYVYQDISIEKPGVYTVEAECNAHHGRNLGINETDVFLFAASGANYENGDSTMVSTEGTGTSQIRGINTKKFSARHIVTQADFDANPYIRIGMWKGASQLATIVEMSGVHLYYQGDYETYLQDSIKSVIQPTRDSLQREINAAKALQAEARNTASVDQSAFNNAMSTAQGIVDNQNATLDQILAQFPAVETAVQNFMTSGVWPAEGKYYDLSFKIQNPTFNEDEANLYAGWDTLNVAPFGIGADGYINYYNNVTTPARMDSASIFQTINGLPAGQYQYIMNTTYRYSNPRNEEFNADAYGSADYIYVVANGVAVAADGLLEIGYLNADGYWQYSADNSAVMSLYDYRHTPTTQSLFSLGYFRTAAEFSVTDGTATIGWYTIGLPTTSCVYAQNPQLHYWGDTVADGIESITTAPAVMGINAPGDIYSISGLKVRANATSFEGLPKGIYIKNGHKVVVK